MGIEVRCKGGKELLMRKKRERELERIVNFLKRHLSLSLTQRGKKVHPSSVANLCTRVV